MPSARFRWSNRGTYSFRAGERLPRPAIENVCRGRATQRCLRAYASNRRKTHAGRDRGAGGLLPSGFQIGAGDVYRPAHLSRTSIKARPQAPGGGGELGIFRASALQSQLGSTTVSQARRDSYNRDTLGSRIVVSVGRPCSPSPITSNIRGARSMAGAIMVFSHAIG